VASPPPEALKLADVIGAVSMTSFCQLVPSPKPEMSGKIKSPPAATLASFNIAPYSEAFNTGIVLTTSCIPE